MKKRFKEESIDLVEDLEKIKDSLANIRDDIKAKSAGILSRSFAGAKDKTHHLQEEVDTYVTDRPYKFIGIAVLTGLVIGYLLNHRD